MKTTIDIADALLAQARDAAKSRNTTVRALVEQGLRQVLAAGSTRSGKMPRRSFKGNGVQPEFDGASWSAIRDAAYGVAGDQGRK